MALEIFDGIPGMGKTYCAMALKILPHLAKGGTVVTNVEVIPDGVGEWILKRTGRKWDPSRLRTISEDQCPRFFQHVPKGTKECPVLVVLDEIHLWFNARDWQKNDLGLRQTFELATQHRKFNLDIVLISQHLSNIDGQFLKLIAGLTRLRNLSKMHPPGFPWIKIPYFHFLALHYDKTGRMLMRRNWLPFDKLVGGSYRTDAVLKGGEAMAGAETVEAVELEKDPATAKKMQLIRRVFFSALGIACLVGLGVWFMGRAPAAPDPATVQAAPAPAPVAAPKPAAVRPVEQEAAPVEVDWIDRKPVHPVLMVRAVSGTKQSPKLLVQLDGAAQWIFPGCYTTRGRVGSVRRLGSDFSLHEIVLWDEAGETVKIRGLLADTLPAGPGIPGQSMGQVVPVSAMPGGQSTQGPGFYQSPQAFIPHNEQNNVLP